MPEHVSKVEAVEAENPDPRAHSTVVVGVAGVLITILIIAGLEVVYHKTAGAEFTRKEIEAVSPELDALHAEQRRQLAAYRWVDKAAGTVAVPIERAMELIVEEHGSK